jgi:hypothetical protein
MAISTLKAIYESRKILLVITEHFLTRDWPLLKIVIDNTIKHRPESIVLILLGKCPIPKEIQQLPVFDLTMLWLCFFCFFCGSGRSCHGNIFDKAY